MELSGDRYINEESLKRYKDSLGYEEWQDTVPLEQECCILRFQGWKVRQISEHSGLPNGKVSSLIHRQYNLHRARIRSLDKEYREECNRKARERRRKNPEAASRKLRDYKRNRIKTDINFRLAHNLRNRLRHAIKNNQKVGSAVRDLGCSVQELKEHLENQFTEGMSWDNYGLYGWHIDHITPLASFNLEDREQFLQAANYTNLQPLWAEDNLRKGDKCEPWNAQNAPVRYNVQKESTSVPSAELNSNPERTSMLNPSSI